MKKNNSPMSDAEAQDSFDFLVKTTCDILKISHDESVRRIDFLFSCGVLNHINPMTEHGIKIVDLITAVPSRRHKEFEDEVKSLYQTANN